MNRTPILVLAVASLALVAGCIGGGTASDGGTTAATDTTTAATDTTTTATDGASGDGDGGGDDGGDDGGTDDGDGGASGGYGHFEFEEGERYVYDVTMGDEPATLVWEVTDVSGDQVTVHLRFEFTVTMEETVTGTRDEIRRKVEDTQFGELITSGLLTPYVSILEDHTLEVGNSWRATTSDGSAEVTITGTDSYAGVECYTTEVSVDGEVRYTACLSPEHGLAVHSIVAPDGETGAQKFELVEYSGATGDGTDGGDGGDGTDGGDGGDGTDSDAARQYTHFEFEEGERYEYDVTMGGEPGSLVWEVTDVSGDVVTVDLRFEFVVTMEETVTGTRDEIRRKVADTRFGDLITSGLLSPYHSALEGHTLEVGNSWRATTSDGSAEVTITGTDSYGGVECYTTELSVNDEVRYTACLSPEHGLAVYASVTPDGKAGPQSVVLELVEYSSGAADGGDGDAGDGGDDSDGDAGDGGDGSDDDGAAVRQYTHFEFEEGERYEYDATLGDEDGTFLWEVTDVSGDEVTVHLDYRIGSITFETTATGTRVTLERRLEATPAGSLMHLGVFHPYYDHYRGHELGVGNSWSASTSVGSATYEVTGTDTYAGVECYTTAVRVDGMLRHEGCVSPELGLVVYSAIYDGTGTKSAEMTLVEYASG